MKHLRGFAIVSAIFILVVLAALGAFILNISTSQQIGSALDVQGARAYQAARAGIEWGLYRQLPLQRDNPPTYTTCAPEFATSGTFPVFGFTVTVSCSADDDGANSGPTVYTVTSTACSDAATCPNTTNPGSMYIERRLSVTF